MSPARAFWSRVERGPGCWRYTGAIGKRHGYGRFRPSGGPEVLAHRHAYEQANGPIPEGLMVLHSCDNRVCVNPAHLFLGTALDNARDAVAKGRNARGEKAAASKLTAEKVAEILRRLMTGERRSEIAEAFGVHKTAIDQIAAGRTWRSVPRPVVAA